MDHVKYSEELDVQMFKPGTPEHKYKCFRLEKSVNVYVHDFVRNS